MPRVLKRLVIDVNGGLSFFDEDAFASPIAEKSGGSRVLVVAVVSRFVTVEYQPHHIRWVPLIKLILKLATYDVVWGSDYISK